MININKDIKFIRRVIDANNYQFEIDNVYDTMPDITNIKEGEMIVYKEDNKLAIKIDGELKELIVKDNKIIYNKMEI